MAQTAKDKATLNGMDAAFSRPSTDTHMSEFGLNKREYFAAMALQGILSNQQLLLNIEGVDGGAEGWAVRCADSLLLELQR